MAFPFGGVDAMSRFKTRLPFLVVGGLILIVGTLVWWLVRRTSAPQEFTASGIVEATEARLGFQAPGRIDEVLAREGDRVAALDVLARLESEEMEARKAQAEAQVAAARALLLELERGTRSEEIRQARAVADAAGKRHADAERDLERANRLFEGGAISREAHDKAVLQQELSSDQRDQAAEALRLLEAGPRPERIQAQRAQLAQAVATVRAVEATLANLTITAPFDGVVTVRHREPGEIVQAGGPVLTVMNPADRWVRIYVPEDRIAAVKLGTTAEITTDTYPDRAYRGEVSFIASEAEFTPKNVQTAEERVRLVYAVKVRIIGDALQDLKSGMPTDVRLDMNEE